MPYDLAEPNTTPDIHYFVGTLIKPKTQNGVDGYIVKWDTEAKPEFVDTLSLLECQF